MKEAQMKTKLSWFDRIMTAATFAEANEHGTAKKFLSGAENMSEDKNHCKDCNVVLSNQLHGAKANS
jgi:hypothetical protein